MRKYAQTMRKHALKKMFQCAKRMPKNHAEKCVQKNEGSNFYLMTMCKEICARNCTEKYRHRNMCQKNVLKIMWTENEKKNVHKETFRKNMCRKKICKKLLQIFFLFSALCCAYISLRIFVIHKFFVVFLVPTFSHDFLAYFLHIGTFFL